MLKITENNSRQKKKKSPKNADAKKKKEEHAGIDRQTAYTHKADYRQDTGGCRKSAGSQTMGGNKEQNVTHEGKTSK